MTPITIQSVAIGLLKAHTPARRTLICQIDGCSNLSICQYSMSDRSGKRVSRTIPILIQVCGCCNLKIRELYNILNENSQG